MEKTMNAAVTAFHNAQAMRDIFPPYLLAVYMEKYIHADTYYKTAQERFEFLRLRADLMSSMGAPISRAAVVFMAVEDALLDLAERQAVASITFGD